jgi:hypothetical protein
VNNSGEYLSRAAVFRAADGALVVEVLLGERNQTSLPHLVAEARGAGADVLWAHGTLVDASLGFCCCGGYARLEAHSPLPRSLTLPSPPRSAVRELQRECFAGVWGHAEPEEPDSSTTFVSLEEDGRRVGICGFDVAGAWIDGPGLIPGVRTPDRFADLVRAACAAIGSRPVTLETWGDTRETLAAYERVGFQLVEHVPGWELRLRGH